ncbi:amidohydrolase [Cytophagaceae bacterium DM2B3-1]|uniref:Amidohydrolase n=1 Tax=Xanthocytophaga flava TaxID=3048013 RepID=A0ABT7CW91_9BACT|nr:amidohydrolase [Xanthocytophaga flavus]MDJ1498017.1 amidohydrolase [Xanthocytophaga flavus]
MENIRITLIQTALHWENPGANTHSLEEKIRNIQEPTDLIVLPEMFSTGFTMDAPAVAEPMNFTTFKWLKMMAASMNAVITGSFVVKENGNFYNRLVWMRPDGSYETYDKRHLFRMANEHETYSAGTKNIYPTIKNWKFLPLVCYDLRFPAWSRNKDLSTPSNGYDCLIYVANWPEARRLHWNTLLQARAIENLSYVVGVNRVGTDGKNISYSGDSVVISHRGEKLFHAEYEEVIKTIELDWNDLQTYREKFPAYLDADTYEIKI